MKCILTIFLFTLTTSVFGQIDTTIIKITSKHYYEYALQERQCNSDNDSNVSDSVFNDVKEITYPSIKTPNQALEKFINDTILKIVAVDKLKKTSPKSWKYDCIDDKPSELYVDYKINFMNSRYLSLTITSDGNAGGGANGASYEQTALTFDLKKRKTLVLKDIIQKQYDSTIYNIVIAEMKVSSPSLFDQFGETNNPNLFHFISTLDLPVAIKKDRIIIYWYTGWGGRSSDEEINIYFDKYADIFDKKFIKTVQKK